MKNKNRLLDLVLAWSRYKDVDNDIKNYNRADTVNMSENEMNKFRHIAGPAILTSELYSPFMTKTLGKFKEAKDILMGRGLSDTINDLYNNDVGIELGAKSEGINRKTLYDYIFNPHIAPYRK